MQRMVRRRLFIRGRVQGVLFRESLREEAERLGVRGSVRNLDDGRVEAALEGRAESVEELTAWAHKGPPAARVEHVEVHDEPVAGDTGFHVVR